ncbi:MAG: hypothetical protein IJW29_03700 [Clostridia bacterium]|nr:hypothetical protein [Clostridia bacterium]
MDTERMELHGTVREGYQILLRADATAELPRAYEPIAAYYRTLAQTCMDWITDVYGERVRERFSALEDVRERARFGTLRYRFVMKNTWESDTHASFLCETCLLGDGVEEALSRRRTAQLWLLDEARILPTEQVVRLFFDGHRPPRPPFVPDGVYPADGALIFFRNPTHGQGGTEWRAACEKDLFCEIKNNKKST